MVICLDAGHGGKDPGAVLGSRYEKNDVLKVVKRVGEILSLNGIKCIYTRTGDTYPTLNDRCRIANNAKANFFASFHRNASGSKTANGFETLVYANANGAKKCADSANSKMTALGFKNRGTVTRKDLAVLNGTSMQAVLFEIGFIDNSTDNSIFDKKFEEICRGLAWAIGQGVGINITKLSESKTESTQNSNSQASASNGKLYRVQVGAFASKANAEKLKAELKAKGYDTIIKES